MIEPTNGLENAIKILQCCDKVSNEDWVEIKKFIIPTGTIEIEIAANSIKNN